MMYTKKPHADSTNYEKWGNIKKRERQVWYFITFLSLLDKNLFSSWSSKLQVKSTPTTHLETCKDLTPPYTQRSSTSILMYFTSDRNRSQPLLVRQWLHTYTNLFAIPMTVYDYRCVHQGPLQRLWNPKWITTWCTAKGYESFPYWLGDN